MTKVEKAVQWAVAVAQNNMHGYSQANRYGNPDYDCSSLTIASFEWAGIPVGNALTTRNMYSEFMANGWSDVTKQINLSNGKGLIAGDVLLNDQNHTCIYIGNGNVVNARTDTDSRPGDSHGDEIRIQPYWDFKPWNHVLRWVESPDSVIDETVDEEVDEPKYDFRIVELLEADSECGKLTAEAIKKFQEANGLEADSVCGENTWEKLFCILKRTTIKKGSVGWHVTALQAALNYAMLVDGD